MEARFEKERWRLDIVGTIGYIRPERSPGYPLSDEIAVVYCTDYDDRLEKARLLVAAPELLEACKAALAYDKAIRSCGNDPERMSSFCTVSGEDLDTLYFSWVNKSRSAIAKAVGLPSDVQLPH